MTFLKTITAVSAAACLVGATAAAAAQSGYQIDTGPYVFSKETVSKEPRHGYSGFYQGPQQLFCDYERTPVRTCDRRGRCRATRWILKEYCY